MEDLENELIHLVNILWISYRTEKWDRQQSEEYLKGYRSAIEFVSAYIDGINGQAKGHYHSPGVDVRFEKKGLNT